MRRTAILLLPLLGGCLDYERVVLTLDVRRGAQTVASEMRSEGMHHSAVRDCADSASCLAELRRLACKEPGNADAKPEDLAHVELREDGTVDLVLSTRRSWDEVAALAEKEGGLVGVWTARGGKEAPRPAYGFVYDDAVLDVAVLHGRFDHLRHRLDSEKSLDTWLLRSGHGTLRATVDISAADDEPTPDAALHWVAKVPGLAEALRATPVSCTGAEAAKQAG